MPCQGDTRSKYVGSAHIEYALRGMHHAVRRRSLRRPPLPDFLSTFASFLTRRSQGLSTPFQRSAANPFQTHLQNFADFIEVQTGRTCVHLGVIGVADVAQEVGAHRSRRKELLLIGIQLLARFEKFLIHFGVIEA